jgi:hypothetical protein
MNVGWILEIRFMNTGWILKNMINEYCLQLEVEYNKILLMNIAWTIEIHEYCLNNRTLVNTRKSYS